MSQPANELFAFYLCRRYATLMFLYAYRGGREKKALAHIHTNTDTLKSTAFNHILNTPIRSEHTQKYHTDLLFDFPPMLFARAIQHFLHTSSPPKPILFNTTFDNNKR